MATCTKITYPTLWHANRTLQEIIRKGSSSGGKLPASVYPCQDCKGWHLTSKRAAGTAKKWQLHSS
ncbi:hypothetical protein ABH915_003313 [Arthrobacter sp. MW3 TE3886]